MVTAANGHEVGPSGFPDGILPLDRHFHRHLDRHRTAVSVENVGKFLREDFSQLFSQSDCRLVGKPTEHHVGHPVQLILGIVVAVHRAPPGGHSLNEGSAVGKGDFAAPGADHLVGRQRIGCRGVGMPEVVPVKVVRQLFYIHNPLFSKYL